MNTLQQTTIEKDVAKKKLFIEREFGGSPEQVWKAWTESALLDQWWAPKPWKTETKSFDFKLGGAWIYAMVGPDGTKSYCRADFKTIDPQKSFTATDAFCDESGVDHADLPHMHWKNEFIETESGTKVVTEITFPSEEELQKTLEMGFEEGFTAAHSNLDELLKE